MPSFNLSILLGQIILYNVFGALIIALAAAMPAFVAATVRPHLKVGLPLVFVAIATIAVALTATNLAKANWPIALLVAGGTIIGLGVRLTEKFRRFWLSGGVLLALIIAVAIFCSGHYGLDNCYP
jgi:hypothetical protein